MADLYKKQNTDVKTGIKLTTEEADWFSQYPRENIVVSGNENRIPLVLLQPAGPAMIPDGGNESIMQTPAPTHGTFMMTQMNRRYGFTGLAQAFDNRAKAGMIESQLAYQANMVVVAFRRGIGLQTYGTSVGTMSVVKTTGSSNATQVIPLKNAFGSSTFVAGGDGGTQDTYLSQLYRVGDHIALIRTGAIVEFGAVTAAPSASLGVGYIDVTFTSAITPTVGDLIVFANADGDNTITGTDYNNWPYGWTEILTGSSLEGVTTSGYSAWAAGSAVTTSQRLSFKVKERMINDCWNAGGVQIDKFIVGQGTRRDAIDGQLGSRRYNSSTVDLDGSLKSEPMTSQLAFPGVLIGWYKNAVTKVELSDMPEEGASKSIFKFDKVQGKSQVAASYDYFYQKVIGSRAACGYASNLTSA